MARAGAERNASRALFPTRSALAERPLDEAKQPGHANVARKLPFSGPSGIHTVPLESSAVFHKTSQGRDRSVPIGRIGVDAAFKGLDYTREVASGPAQTEKRAASRHGVVGLAGHRHAFRAARKGHERDVARRKQRRKIGFGLQREPRDVRKPAAGDFRLKRGAARPVAHNDKVDP
jgi:hypothetical protein